MRSNEEPKYVEIWKLSESYFFSKEAILRAGLLASHPKTNILLGALWAFPAGKKQKNASELIQNAGGTYFNNPAGLEITDQTIINTRICCPKGWVVVKILFHFLR